MAAISPFAKPSTSKTRLAFLGNLKDRRGRRKMSWLRLMRAHRGSIEDWLR